MKKMMIMILAMTIQVSYAQHDDHAHHHSPAPVNHQDKNFKKFVPTKDLKVRMEKILNLMMELKDKKDDQKAVKTYGVKVEDIVKDIIKTCKLDPKADAAIHPALGQIMKGSRDLQKGNYKTGLSKIHESLLEYGKLFSHEGWKH